MFFFPIYKNTKLPFNVPIQPSKPLIYEYIQKKEDLESSFIEIKKAAKISIDCEGEHLSRKGHLSTVQIKIEDGKLFIFDYLLLKEDLIQSLREILEDEKLTKLTWDFRNDYDLLSHQFNIHALNIIDVQLLDFWSNTSLNKNSDKLAEDWYKQIQSGKVAWKKLVLPSLKKNRFEKINYSEFLKRPLTDKLLEYSARDVSLIFERFGDLEKEMNTFKNFNFLKCSLQYVRMYSDLGCRDYNEWEANEVMPVHIFVQSNSFCECSFCRYRVPKETLTKINKRCLRCLLKKKLLEKEEAHSKDDDDDGGCFNYQYHGDSGSEGEEDEC